MSQFLSGCCDRAEWLPWQAAWPVFRSLCLVGAMLLAGTNLAPGLAAPPEFSSAATSNEGEAKSGESKAERAIIFDIPAQSLAAAVDAYSISAHREVVYNGELAIGRQSAAVKGNFTPEA